jgi:MoxR-like ATPase
MNEQEINTLLTKLDLVSSEVGKIIVGQQDVVQQLLVSIMAGGHCLLEGVPGLAKTLMVSTLSTTLALDFKRVQFTPDLMPSDIIGTEILATDKDSGERFFKFQKGPLFTHILLADEINRTPAKTQAALLEAMQEKHVSYGGKHYDLPAPFFVLATQNPIEQSGTYPLPEAQLDRFLMFVRVEYPTYLDEIEILRRTTGTYSANLAKTLSAADVLQLQQLTRAVDIGEPLLNYVSDLVRSTRAQHSTVEAVAQYVRWGAGPRAGQALVLCAKAQALLQHRFSVTISDIEAIAHAVLRHRIIVNFEAEAQGISTDSIVDILLSKVAKPQSALNA